MGASGRVFVTLSQMMGSLSTGVFVLDFDMGVGEGDLFQESIDGVLAFLVGPLNSIWFGSLGPIDVDFLLFFDHRLVFCHVDGKGDQVAGFLLEVLLVTTSGLPVVRFPYMPAALRIPIPCCPRVCLRAWNLDP